MRKLVESQEKERQTLDEKARVPPKRVVIS